MTKILHALIFDMDGVIADTIEPHYKAWKRLTAEEGIPFTEADNDALRGLARRDCLNYVFRGQPLSETRALELMDRKQRYFLEHLAQMTPEDCLPGVRELITEARAYGLKVGLASSSQNVANVLERLQIAPLFHAIASHFTISNPKPKPDIFIWTAGRLNVHPWEAIIFEDSQAGVQAGLEGGFTVLGLGDPEIVGAAQIVRPSLAGITLAELAEIAGFALPVQA
jgi:beta-phosphoglucomutase